MNGGAGGAVTSGAGGAIAKGALHFDGVDDVVTLPADPGGANEDSFSSELWFRTTALTGMLFEVYTPGGGADRSTYLKDGTVCFYVYTPNYSELCTSNKTWNDGRWHHAAGTLGLDGQHLYLDGQLVATAATVTRSAFQDDMQFQLGKGHIGPWGPIVFFSGDVDEVRLWKVQRTEKEIAANLRSSIFPIIPDLQGYWRLDESGTANTAADDTSSAHRGILSGFSFTPSPWISPGAF
jgi:hypothetical protein